jgi:ribose-phosphate pyrophosphokinase
VLVEHFLPLVTAEKKIVVVSPDIGGVQRARAFASLLGESAKCPVDSAFIEKHRSEGIVSGDLFAGDVRDASVIVIDDMICGGTTMERAAKACKERGAASVHVAATHGIFGPDAERHLGIAEISSIAVTDTIPDAGARCPSISRKLQVLETADLIGSIVEPLVTP